MENKKYQIGDLIRLDYNKSVLYDITYPHKICGSYGVIASGFYDNYDKKFYYRLRFKVKNESTTVSLDLTEPELDMISLKVQPHPFTTVFK